MLETILEILTRSITRVSIRSLRNRDYSRRLVSEPEKQTCVYSVFKILTLKTLQFQNSISRVVVLKSKFSFLYINNREHTWTLHPHSSLFIWWICIYSISKQKHFQYGIEEISSICYITYPDQYSHGNWEKMSISTFIEFEINAHQRLGGNP